MKKLIGIILAASTTLALTGCGVITFSDGDRTGKVIKLSKKGVMVKTWEGELALTDMRTFKFTVRDESLVEIIKAKSVSGETTTLTYTQKMLPAKWQGDTGYWITAVK